MRTNFYIDGFNLYYGCVKGTTERWLNIGAVCERLFPQDQIHRIRYFTALVNPPPNDPRKLQRQQVYIRALETIGHLSVHYGRFQTSKVDREPVLRAPGDSRTIRVFDPKEKGSDVNLATYLLVDGFQKDYERAVVVSNDSDLCLPIEKVITELKLPVLVVCPVSLGHRHPSRELCQVATSIRTLRPGLLRSCQFPSALTDANGVITKPSTW
jgi:hypothetical protein